MQNIILLNISFTNIHTCLASWEGGNFAPVSSVAWGHAGQVARRFSVSPRELWSRFVPETAPLEGSRSLDLQGPFAAAASERMVWAQAGMLAQPLFMASKVNSKRRSLLQLRVALFHDKEKIQAFEKAKYIPSVLGPKEDDHRAPRSGRQDGTPGASGASWPRSWRNSLLPNATKSWQQDFQPFYPPNSPIPISKHHLHDNLSVSLFVLNNDTRRPSSHHQHQHSILHSAWSHVQRHVQVKAQAKLGALEDNRGSKWAAWAKRTNQHNTTPPTYPPTQPNSLPPTLTMYFLARNQAPSSWSFKWVGCCAIASCENIISGMLNFGGCVFFLLGGEKPTKKKR